MNRNTTIVTSVYYNCAGHPYYCTTTYGEPRTYRYFHSLENILNMGYPVICYTSKDFGCYDELYQFFIIDRKITNLTLKISEISDYPHHKRIVELREKYPVYNERYYDRPIEIYWAKFMFVGQELQSNEYVYWMDAGLSSFLNFPKRLSTNRVPRNVHAPDAIFDLGCFNDTLFDRINAYAQNRVVNIGRHNSSDADMSGVLGIRELITPQYENNVATYGNTPFNPVGGFFGGSTKNSHLREYVNEYQRIIDIAIKYDQVCVDEAIMGYINLLHRSDNWFRNYYFANFYTEDETNPLLHMNEDGSIIHHFYRFFEDNPIVDMFDNTWP